MKMLTLLTLFLSAHLFGGTLSTESTATLIQAGQDAQKKAYAPYSKYYVGSAVLTKSGKIYTGCNVENASYGLTICAERTAVFKAVSDGDKEIEAIAVITRDGGACCGACRQVLNEFNPEMIVICADEQGQIHHTFTLSQLLPQAFGPRNLD